jgi:putative polymerase
MFNIVLAWINAHVNGSQLVAVQGALLAGAAALAALGPARERFEWLLLLWAMLVWWLLMSFLREAVQFKYLGDVAAFPVFAALGALIPPRRFVPLLLGLQLVIVMVGLWEALYPRDFGSTFNVALYYVNTRGVEATQFNEDLGGLYLNAARPVGRLLLPQTGWLRVSSIFLEPVSLGNWTIVVSTILGVFWKSVSWRNRLLLIASNLLLIVMCDGRLAIMVNIVVIALLPASRWLPRWLPLLFPLIAYGILAAARGLGVLHGGADDLPGRLLKGMVYFERMSATELMGIVPQVQSNLFDSGWAYFAQSQSILGLTAFWVALVLMLPIRTTQSRRLLFAVSGFFTLSLPVSNAFLSIKAASLLFAIYGGLRHWERPLMTQATTDDRRVQRTRRQAARQFQEAQ